MNTLRTSLLALSVATLVGACAQKTPQAPAATPSDNVAQVNGKPISRNTYNFYVKGVAGKPAEDLTDDQRAELLDALIRGELVATAAEAGGIAARDETRAVMELSRLTVLQQAATQDYLKDRKATPEELQKEYETQITAMPRMEYHVRHILVPSEEQARSLISQLGAGGNFAALAKRDSTDQGSRDNGGDLDWSTPERMVKPFGDAMLSLKKGEYTKTPVQTSFGWHVIRLEDSRPVPAPAFESVKDRISQIVEAKKFQTYTDGLLKTAKIEKTL